MNHIELAWAAGFFDGEGSIGTYANGHLRRNGTRGLVTRLTITQKDSRPLWRFWRAVGNLGNVTQRRPDASHLYGMYALQLVKRADVHQAVWLLWPWLSEPKREQIARAC